MKFSVPKESDKNETRVAVTPDTVKRILALFDGATFSIEKGAGDTAAFTDASYKEAGATIVTAAKAYDADVVLRVNAPTAEEAKKLKKGSLLIGNLDPFAHEALFKSLAKAGVNALAMERIPRISRAQAMDTLSSQANIAGYRAVLEASNLYNKFFPVMMTAAGSSKPANVIVLGVGVAGLQAIATAKRLGAKVQAFDVRPEVKEQVESLGAKFIEIDLGEDGSGEGGYAKELSKEAQKKQQAALQEILKKADIVITTAQIPGRAAPELVTEGAVKGMAAGSIVVDMAAGGYNLAHQVKGGNCKLTEADKVVEKHGVTIVGYTNYAGFVASDASSFFGRNIFNLLKIMVGEDKTKLHYDMEDEIIAKALVAYEGEVR